MAKLRMGSTLLNLRRELSRGEEYLSTLAPLLSNSKTDKHLIQLEHSRGNGTINLLESGDGFTVVIWDLQVNHRMEIPSLPRFPTDKRCFLLAGILTPESLQIVAHGTGQHLPNTLFSSEGELVSFTLLPNFRTKAVFIYLEEDWLIREFKDAEPDLLFLVHDLILKTSPLLFSEQAGFQMYQGFSDILHLATKSPGDLFGTKTKTLAIVYDIFGRLLDLHTIEQRQLHPRLQDKMTAIEKILDEHMYGKLPCIKTIAKNVALSESTLKRNFKDTYGVSFYGYYLQKKMLLARQMLDERPVAVKEIAYMLGYEKPSSFIKIFKKFYEFSPYVFRKKFLRTPIVSGSGS